ncbi:MAG: hypothetical protein ACK4IS_03560 [Erythrobacter sp.]
MKHLCAMIALLLGFAGISAMPSEARAQAGLDPEFLEEIQGRWVSRFPRKDHAVEITGNVVRVSVADPTLKDGSKPGMVVAIITDITRRTPTQSLIDGRPIIVYGFKARMWTTDGTRWHLSEKAYDLGFLSISTRFCSNSQFLDQHDKPISEHRTIGGMWGGDMFRPDHKDAVFPPNDQRPNWADPVIPKCADVPAPRRPQQGNTGSPTRFTPPPSTAAAAGSVRPTPPSPPAEPLTAPVTAAQVEAELATREQLNREQAAFAARQLAENKAAQEAFDKATREREATIARQQAEYQAALAAQQAEAARREREHAAAMERWRADVAACKAGNASRCKPREPQR